MSETLKPGLYRATVRGKINVTVLIDSGGYGTTADLVSAHHVHEQHNIEHARALIVLNPKDADVLCFLDQYDGKGLGLSLIHI